MTHPLEELARPVTAQECIADLNRVKALFQARTIAAVMGLPAPASLRARAAVEEG